MASEFMRLNLVVCPTCGGHRKLVSIKGWDRKLACEIRSFECIQCHKRDSYWVGSKGAKPVLKHV